jgi:hypothetical protein
MNRDLHNRIWFSQAEQTTVIKGAIATTKLGVVSRDITMLTCGRQLRQSAISRANSAIPAGYL